MLRSACRTASPPVFRLRMLDSASVPPSPLLLARKVTTLGLDVHRSNDLVASVSTRNPGSKAARLVSQLQCRTRRAVAQLG